MPSHHALLFTPPLIPSTPQTPERKLYNEEPSITADSGSSAAGHGQGDGTDRDCHRRGAALIAAANLGLIDDLPAAACAHLESEHQYQPNSEYTAVYDRLFEQSARLSEAVEPLLRTEIGPR